MQNQVQVTKAKLDAEHAAYMRRGYVHDDVSRAAWQAAYEAWMCARGVAGDAFALMLGYGPDGWSYDRWLVGHQRTHGTGR